MERLNNEPSCCRKCKIKGDGTNCMGCLKPNKTKTHFICEICHCITPIECEGSEPNTCADCMPLTDSEN